MSLASRVPFHRSGLVLAAAAALLLGCGGGGGGGEGVAPAPGPAPAPSPAPAPAPAPSPAPPPNGLLSGRVFPALEGMRYRTASQGGVLDAQGRFEYRAGEQLSLEHGPVEIANLAAAEKLTPLAGVGDEQADEGLARLLVAMDQNGGRSTAHMKLRTLPVSGTLPVGTGSDAALHRSLRAMEPQAALPAADDERVKALAQASLAQSSSSTAAAFGGAEYLLFDATLGRGRLALSGIGSEPGCAAPARRVRQARLLVQPAPAGASEWPGRLELEFSDGVKAGFDYRAASGSVDLAGRRYDYRFDRYPLHVHNFRVIPIELTESAKAGQDCATERLALRDAKRPNTAPSIAFSRWTSMELVQVPGGSPRFDTTQHFAGRLVFHTYKPYKVLGNQGDGDPEQAAGSYDSDGRIVSLTVQSSRDGVLLQRQAQRDGSEPFSFQVPVRSGADVTITATATDDEGATATASYVVKASGSAKDDLLLLLAGKTYSLDEDGVSYYYRLSADGQHVIEWELDGGRCSASRVTLEQAAQSLDFSRAAVQGTVVTVPDGRGQLWLFRQVLALPKLCGAVVVPGEPAPSPAPTPSPAPSPAPAPAPAPNPVFDLQRQAGEHLFKLDQRTFRIDFDTQGRIDRCALDNELRCTGGITQDGSGKGRLDVDAVDAGGKTTPRLRIEGKLYGDGSSEGSYQGELAPGQRISGGFEGNLTNPRAPSPPPSPPPTTQLSPYPDADGCFAVAGDVVELLRKWSSSSAGTLLLNVRNHGDKRVYVRYGAEKKGGRIDEGASGVKPGGGLIMWMPTYEASGRAGHRAVGSLYASKDWVCAGKHPDWRLPLQLR